MIYTYRFGHNYTTTSEELTGYDDRIEVTEEEAQAIDEGANIEMSDGTIELTIY